MRSSNRLPRRALAGTIAAVAMVLASCGTDEDGSETPPAEDTGDESAQDAPEDAQGAPEDAQDDAQDTPESADETGVEVTMRDADDGDVGTVLLSEIADGVRVEASMHDLEAGVHGFHLHETPECDPAAADGPFDSADGHYAPEDEDHGEHAGDLPSLLVNEDGTAELAFTTHAVTLDEITGDDGVAVMVHAEPDNFGHIPERYTSEDGDDPGPDQETLDTGDAGDRVACGVADDEDATPSLR